MVSLFGKTGGGTQGFTRMGGKEYAVTELAAIEAASACQTQEGGYRQLLNPAMYKVLTIGVVMAILQQWCGINVILTMHRKYLWQQVMACLMF